MRQELIRMYSRAAIALLLMLLTATTAGANVTVTYELKGEVGGHNAYSEICRQDNTSLNCQFSHVSGTDTPYWNANDTQGVDDKYDITFTPNVRLRGWKNGDDTYTGFQTDKKAVNMTVTSNSSYYIVSVTLKKYDGTVLVSATNDNDKSCTVSMPATSESQCISQAVIELSQAHAVTVPDNISLSGGTFVGNVNGKPNYLEGSVITLTPDDADKVFKTLSVSGATYSLAADKKSATVTIGSSDVTVTATLMALTGTSNGVTWRVSDEDGNGTYDRLTLSGSGTLSTSPWATDFASSITRVDVSSTGIAISGNPFGTLGSGAVIVVPTPAYAVSYASATFASRLRVALGSYLFGVTDEGGTPAYKIANADDLRRLATAINATGNYASTDKTFRQTDDINLASGGNFTPIGANGGSKSFFGTYDGGNHTISGLSVSIKYGDISLFGMVRGATVRNVTLVSPTLTATTTQNFEVRLGAVIGTCDGGANNVVENCHVVNPTVSSSSTSSQNYVGAIIGNIHDTNTTVTNCYYYGGNATAAYGYKENGAPVTNVGRAHKVTLGDGVTGISPAATAPENGFVYGSESYYREGLTLTLASNPPEGYAPVYSANGTAFSGTTYTVNSNDGNDVTLSATFVLSYVSVSYIDENGAGQSADALLLQGGGATSLSGWYYVNGTVNITGKVTLDGDVHIILRDGATLNIGTATERISSNCIGGKYKTLTIYGQSGQTGTLKAYNSASSSSSAVYARNYTQHGGNVIIDATNDNPLYLSGGNLTISRGTLSVTAAGSYSAIKLDTGKSVNISGGTLTATSESGNAIQSDVNMSGGTLTATTTTDTWSYAIYGDITFTGGKLTANGVNRGNSGNVSLSWSSLYDSFTCNRYGGTVSIAEGKTFYDETGASYTSSTPDLKTVLAGKTLRPWGPADWADNGDGSYTIGSAAGWDIFCDALLDNDTYNRFSGKTVYLGNNIGTAQNPVTRMAGSSSHDFCGTFDGNKKTLTFTSTENIDGVAPFSYISNVNSIPAVIRNLNVVADINTTATHASGLVGRMWGTLTIEGCTVGGTIQTSNKYAAGFIAEQNGTASITDCVSSVTIKSSVSGDGTHGGFVAVPSNTLNITGSAFTGKLLTTNGTTKCGGFVGWYNGQTVKVTNSIYAPAALTDGEIAITDESATFVRGNSSSSNITNSYYTQALGGSQGEEGILLYDGGVPATANAGVISRNNNKQYDVKLQGRTLYKDGKWNTLCLPFEVSTTTGPLSGDGVVAMTLNDEDSGLSGTTLTLNFNTVTSTIAAGTPFIIKWNNGTNITDPVFEGVTVSNANNDVSFDGGSFKGTYDWQQYTTENKSILFLGEDNTLYWPKPDLTTDPNNPKYPTIGAFRAYFQLNSNVLVREFKLGFGSEETSSIHNSPLGPQGRLPEQECTIHNEAGAWFDLNGRRLDAQPTAKGVYIHEGRKVVIK